MKLLMDENKDVVPAMPDDPFEMIADFKKVFLQHNRATALTPSMYDTSMTTVFQVKNVPLKPDHKIMRNPEHRAALKESHDSLQTLIPDSIMAVNIGANEGFMRLMRMHYEGNHQHLREGCEVYSSFNVDCDIFDRMLKVVLH